MSESGNNALPADFFQQQSGSSSSSGTTTCTSKDAVQEEEEEEEEEDDMAMFEAEVMAVASKQDAEEPTTNGSSGNDTEEPVENSNLLINEAEDGNEDEEDDSRQQQERFEELDAIDRAALANRLIAVTKRALGESVPATNIPDSSITAIAGNSEADRTTTVTEDESTNTGDDAPPSSVSFITAKILAKRKRKMDKASESKAKSACMSMDPAMWQRPSKTSKRT